MKYPILNLSKEDILYLYADNDDKKVVNKVNKIVEKMSDEDMKYLAGKLGDDYCEQLYWDSLLSIFEDRFLNKR